MRPVAFAAATLVLVSGAALAADNGQVDRYRLEKTADGYVRMDTATGEMSICAEKDGQLVCRMAADERRALEDEIARLSNRLGEIEARVARLEEQPPSPAATMPSDEEIDQSLDLMEKFFRRFMGVVKELDKEKAGQPDRT